jgi:hypothetical protein
MRAAWRAAGRRARRSTGQATGDRAAMRPVGLSPPCVRRGRAPSDRRWPYRLHFVGVGAAPRAPTRLQLLGLARVTLMPASRAPIRLVEIATPRPVPSPFASWRFGDLPASPERASSEVPGCGHASCRCTRGSVPASARSLACGCRSFASHRARLRCLGPKTSWRPACRAARDGAVSAGHLPPLQRRDIRIERCERGRGGNGEPGGGGDFPAYRRRCGGADAEAAMLATADPNGPPADPPVSGSRA